MVCKGGRLWCEHTDSEFRDDQLRAILWREHNWRRKHDFFFHREGLTLFATCGDCLFVGYSKWQMILLEWMLRMSEPGLGWENNPRMFCGKVNLDRLNYYPKDDLLRVGSHLQLYCIPFAERQKSQTRISGKLHWSARAEWFVIILVSLACPRAEQSWSIWWIECSKTNKLRSINHRATNTNNNTCTFQSPGRFSVTHLFRFICLSFGSRSTNNRPIADNLSNVSSSRQPPADKLIKVKIY